MPIAASTILPPPSARFRAVPLDGAMLYFDRASGTHVRIATPATAACRREAPRVAMFGITNACDLDCAFCSRDRTRPSRWTVASAAAALRGLAEAGTLEVAFGGGEPFVFPGFAELLRELRATTPLALHVTSNGSFITPTAWPAYAGLLDMVRVSIYADATWRRAGAVLTAARQRWGANILVDDAALDRLPELLAELAELAVAGCGDASILTFVGTTPDRQLTAAGRGRLAAVIAESPIPTRLSVCAGGGVPAPLLHHGLDGSGDCGAGLDFVSITPDQGMLACSFQDGQPLPARTAEEILVGWRARHARMAAPSPRIGCARRDPTPATTAPLARIAVWRSFSGNNSGECVMVATFAAVADAEAYLAELLPGWNAGEKHSAEWVALFAREQVVAPSSEDVVTDWSESPRDLLAIGRSVIALGYDADDIFPPLRGLAWKRGARVMPGGIHVHDPLTVLAAIRCRDADEVRATASACAADPRPFRTWPHGDRLLVALVLDARGDPPITLTEAKSALESIAAGRPLAAEIVLTPFDEARLIAVKQRLGAEPPMLRRLVANFRDSERAHAFARSLHGQPATVGGHTVLIEGSERPKRLAVLAYRHGAHVTALDGGEVAVNAYLWHEPKPRAGTKAITPAIDTHLLTARLVGLATDRVIAFGAEPERGRCSVRFASTDPGASLTALAIHAAEIGSAIHMGLDETDPLAWAVRRVLTDAAVG